MTTRVLWVPPLTLVHARPLLYTSGLPHPLHAGLLPLPCLFLPPVCPGRYLCHRALLMVSQTMADRLFPCHGSTKKVTGSLFKTHQSPPGSPFPPSTPSHPGKVGFEPSPLGPPMPARSWELGITVTSPRKSGPLAAYGAPAPSPGTHREAGGLFLPLQPAGPCHYLREFRSTPETAPGMFSYQQPR